MGIHTWGGGNCGCVDGAGVLALPSGGALAVEVNPALSGAVRLPNGTAIRMRNEANAADLDALEVDASNELHVGGPFVAANRVERTWLGADVEAAVVVDGTKRLSVRDLVELNASTLRFASSVSSPTVTQETDATASANGDALAIQAQTCTGASSVGGSVHVQPGQGTSQSGEVAVKDGGGTTRLNVTSAGDVVVSADSLVRLSTGGTVRAEVDSTALQLNSLPIGSETPAVTTRTLVWEMRPPTAGTTDHITRVYRYRYGLEVTVNARWTGTQWQKDAADRASRLLLERTKLQLDFHETTATTPFSDAAWTGTFSLLPDGGESAAINSSAELYGPGSTESFIGHQCPRATTGTNTNVGSGCTFRKQFPATPSSVTFNLLTWSGISGSPNPYQTTPYGTGAYVATSASAGTTVWFYTRVFAS